MNEIKDLVIINHIGYDLEMLEKDCWLQLVNGAVKSKDPFHTFAVASLNSGEISLRTVVLRKASPIDRTLNFHTDTRSRKWDELASSPSISALFYNATARVQLRMKGRAVLHYNNEITYAAWQKTALSSRRCYLIQPSPSSFSDHPTSGLTEQIEQENFTLEESEIGYQHFGIVTIQVESMEWLWLHHAGHRRAYFDYVNRVNRWMIP